MRRFCECARAPRRWCARYPRAEAAPVSRATRPRSRRCSDLVNERPHVRGEAATRKHIEVELPCGRELLGFIEPATYRPQVSRELGDRLLIHQFSPKSRWNGGARALRVTPIQICFDAPSHGSHGRIRSCPQGHWRGLLRRAGLRGAWKPRFSRALARSSCPRTF
jgi:hypothetical protein